MITDDGRRGTRMPVDVEPRSRMAPRLPVAALGLSLGLFLAITYLLCVGYDLLFPGMAMSGLWLRLLPGATSLGWGGFLLGLVESFAYGWYIALIFAPLFNLFSAKWG